MLNLRIPRDRKFGVIQNQLLVYMVFSVYYNLSYIKYNKHTDICKTAPALIFFRISKKTRPGRLEYLPGPAS